MGALPRPDLPPGPQRDLTDALHGLHHRAGWPCLRTLAREAGVSHTTVSKVFSSPRSRPGECWSCSSRRWRATSRSSISSGSPPAPPPGRRPPPGSPGAATSSPPYAATSTPAPASSWSPARPASARPRSSPRPLPEPTRSWRPAPAAPCRPRFRCCRWRICFARCAASTPPGSTRLWPRARRTSSARWARSCPSWRARKPRG